MPPTFLGSVFEFVGEFLAEIVSVFPWGSSRRGHAAPMWSIWIGLGVILAALFAVYVWLV